MGKFTGVATAMAGIMDRNYTRQYEDRKRMEEQRRQDEKRKQQGESIRRAVLGLLPDKMAQNLQSVPSENIPDVASFFVSGAENERRELRANEQTQQENEGLKTAYNIISPGLGDKMFPNPNVRYRPEALQIMKDNLDKTNATNKEIQLLEKLNAYGAQLFPGKYQPSPTASAATEQIDDLQQGERDIAEQGRAKELIDYRESKEPEPIPKDLKNMSSLGKKILQLGAKILTTEGKDALLLSIESGKMNRYMKLITEDEDLLIMEYFGIMDIDEELGGEQEPQSTNNVPLPGTYNYGNMGNIPRKAAIGAAGLIGTLPHPSNQSIKYPLGEDWAKEKVDYSKRFKR